MNGLSKYDPFHDGNGNSRRLSDPILIAGGGLASKTFFNYIWSKSHSGIFELAEGVELEDELRQMFDYISAIGLKRWAVVADMDLEPELEELLEEKIQAGDGLEREWLAADLFDANAVINMFGEPKIPYPDPTKPILHETNEEALYSDETNAWLDYWAGQLLDRGAYTTYDHCGYGNDMFWVMGEKEPGSRPSFKLAAHKILSDALVSNCDYVWEGAYENVSMELVDAASAKHGNWSRYHASTPGDVRQMRFDELGDVPATGSYIVAVPDSFDTCSGYSRIVDASVLGLVPDDAERFLVFGYPAYAATDRLMEAAREAAEPWFSSPPGEWPKVLYDPNMMFADDDEDDSAVIPPDAFQPASEFADWKDNEERYEGTVTDSFKARLEALPKYRLGYDLLQEIVPYSIEVNVTLDGAFEELLPLMTFGRLSGAPSPGMPFGGAGLASVEKFVMGTPDLESFVGVPAEADEIIRRIWQKSSPIRTLDGQEGELAPEELSWHIERAIEDNGLTGKIFEAASLGVPASDIFA